MNIKELIKQLPGIGIILLLIPFFVVFAVVILLAPEKE